MRRSDAGWGGGRLVQACRANADRRIRIATDPAASGVLELTPTAQNEESPAMAVTKVPSFSLCVALALALSLSLSH